MGAISSDSYFYESWEEQIFTVKPYLDVED